MANSLSSVLGLAGLSGGGGVPPGSFVVVPRAPLNFTYGSAEYLRTSNIKAYSSGYDAALAVAPQLGVFGSNTKQHNTYTSTAVQYYAYVGSNYVSSSGYYSSDLDTWVAATGITIRPEIRPAVGNGYMVGANAAANTPLAYSTTGATFTAVGGGFGTNPPKTALCYAPSVGWLALSSLDGAAGSVFYISNINPTGTWTQSNGTSLGMSQVSAVAYGNGVFVAVGTSSLATAGKIATCATLGGAWTDRTAASGVITFASTNGADVVFTGTHFIVLLSTGVVARSTDGVTWTVVLRESGQIPARAATNGAGTVVITPNATAGLAGMQPVFWVSKDHGASFVQRQIYVGKIAGQSGYAAPSYANGQFFINHAGIYTSPQEIGQADTPDFVGWSSSVIDPTGFSQYYVRIK